MPSENIVKHFGNRLRVRVNGILIENERILMVKHVGLGETGYLWAPPGGGIEFGTSAPQNLEREFLEETGLMVEVKDFLFTCEFINAPLHAIELFFIVKKKSGLLGKGKDPELQNSAQIIETVAFLSIERIKNIPVGGIHKVFHDIESFDDIIKKRGYYAI